MGITINVDIGGTFTDFFASQDHEKNSITKAPTTHYDLSVGFMKGVNELANINGLGLSDFLGHCDAVRYCTTLGTNALIERTGPKLGLITTAGFEDTIFLGRARSWADGGTSKENKDLARIKKPDPLISRDMVVGVRERIDSFGNVICPLKREEVLERLQILVDRGAMGFVVCLLWSFMNPEHERMIKEIIEEEYPEDYLGGKMMLDPDLSKEAIEKKIAKPLGIDLVEAAIRIRKIVDARMGQEVFNEVALKGHDPRDFVLFACGGAGATHACGFAPYLQVNKVIVSNYSPVFGAFGASTVNIQQVWEKSRTLKIFQWATQSYSEDIDNFNGVVDELKDLALRDLRLEGFGGDQIQFRLELDMRYGMQYNLTKIVSPHLNVRSTQDFKDICDRFTEQYSAIYTPEATFPMGGINVECFYLTAFVERPDPVIEKADLEDSGPPDSARLSSRQAYWTSAGGFEQTPVFSFQALKPGNVITGPALIEAPDTTYVIEPNWRFTLDAYHNGILEQL